jgi:GTP:adenosylcobinamide-phosphate guanylyltransferase
MEPITAIVLAGERPGGDALARSLGVPAKALIPIAGEPMIVHVVRALAAHPSIGKVRVLAQRPELLAADLAGSGAEIAESRQTIAATIRELIASGAEQLLVTTADNPLLDAPILDEFLGSATVADVAVGLVERETLSARYPGNRRTWLRFRGGAYSGANLFWVGGKRALPLLDIWAGVEQQRKRGRAVIAAFGPGILLGVVLRVLSLDQALARVSRRFRVTARAVRLPFAEACIDVDKLDDLELVEAIFKRRG